MPVTKRQQRRIDRARVHLGAITMNNLHNYLDIKYSGYPITCSQDDCLNNTYAWKREVASYQYWLETGLVGIISAAPNAADIVLDAIKSRPSQAVLATIQELQFLMKKSIINNTYYHHTIKNGQWKTLRSKILDVKAKPAPSLLPIQPYQLKIGSKQRPQQPYCRIVTSQHETTLSPTVNYFESQSERLYGHFNVDDFMSSLNNINLDDNRMSIVGTLPSLVKDLLRTHGDPLTKLLLGGKYKNTIGRINTYVLPSYGDSGFNPYTEHSFAEGFIPNNFTIFGQLHALSTSHLIYIYCLMKSFRRELSDCGIGVAIKIDRSIVSSDRPEGLLPTFDGRMRVRKKHRRSNS